MTNPFAGVGVPDGSSEIQGLVDQAVILQSALVPKLPEIGITDGMIPIIDQVYPDSGSASTFTPGTTINFNFGNAHGKLVDWTQSRLSYTVNCRMKITYGGTGTNEYAEDANHNKAAFNQSGICLCLRHGAMVFSQVTFGGAGRPITINDFEMVALARSLLTTAESNVTSHIGDLSTHDWIGCGTVLPDRTVQTPHTTVTSEWLHVPIKVSVPLTSVMPMFGTVDNYLLSTTSGIELRLTVTSNPRVLALSTANSYRNTLVNSHIMSADHTANIQSPLYGKFQSGQVSFSRSISGAMGSNQATTYNGKITFNQAEILSLENVKIDLISTQHPDDYIVNMLNNICSTRGLFYPNQMFIATPFRCEFKQSTQPENHAFLVPVVSGYRNIDAIFCWFTKQDEPCILRKLPITNIYTSLNGTFKMPVHGFQDHCYDHMTETAAQFNRCFGTINSTLLSPMKDIMDGYKPMPFSNAAALVKRSDNGVPDSAIPVDADGVQHAIAKEIKNNDSFIANATMWELEKSSWMNGPDFSQHSNKYQIVFTTEQVPVEMAGNYTFWVIQRFDAYTHVYNGYVNLLTTKEEVAMALAQAQAGQAITH